MFKIEYACTHCQHATVPAESDPCTSCVASQEGWTKFVPATGPERRPASEIMLELARRMATAQVLAARAAEAEASLTRTLGVMRSLMIELNQHIK